MSNTTPESPNTEPNATEPATTGAEAAEAESAENDAVERDTVERNNTETVAAEPGSASTSDAPGTPDAPVAERSAVRDEDAEAVDDDVAPVAPVASSSHVSGSADTGQTWAPEPTPVDRPVADQPVAGQTVADQTVAAEPVTGQHPTTPAYVAAQPVYVTAPQPPKRKGNRGGGILIALLSAVVYAIVSALVVLVIFAITKSTTDIAMRDFVQYLGTASYYIPIVFFFLAFILLIAIVNRGGWWAYILGAFFVGAIVYFAYIGGVLLTIQAWQFSPAEVGRILSQLWANPLTIGAAVVAREVPIWFGAWIAARGRKVRDRNDEAQRQYERDLAAGPQPVPRTA